MDLDFHLHTLVFREMFRELKNVIDNFISKIERIECTVETVYFVVFRQKRRYILSFFLSAILYIPRYPAC